MEWPVLLALSLAVGVYTVLGSFMFSAVEQPYTATLLDINKNTTNQIKARYAHLDPQDIDEIIQDVAIALREQKLTPNDTVLSWSFFQSFFFVGTVVTTIGYGNVAPVTPMGRLLCVFFALFGIPLNFALLAGIGSKLNVVCRRLDFYLAYLVKHKTVVGLLRTLFLFFVGWAVFIQLPALYFVYIGRSNWNYIDATYFAFTTLSTLGFGDVVPDAARMEEMTIHRVIILIWLWVGLSWLSTVINSMQDVIQVYAQRHKNRAINAVADKCQVESNATRLIYTTSTNRNESL